MRFHMNGGHVPNPPLRPGQVVTGGSGGAEATSSGRSCMSREGQLQEHSTSQQQVVTGGSGGAESNLFWALVYVPQGTTAQGHSTSQQQAQLQAACTNPTSLS